MLFCSDDHLTVCLSTTSVEMLLDLQLRVTRNLEIHSFSIMSRQHLSSLRSQLGGMDINIFTCQTNHRILRNEVFLRLEMFFHLNPSGFQQEPTSSNPQDQNFKRYLAALGSVFFPHEKLCYQIWVWASALNKLKPVGIRIGSVSFRTI